MSAVVKTCLYCGNSVIMSPHGQACDCLLKAYAPCPTCRTWKAVEKECVKCL